MACYKIRSTASKATALREPGGQRLPALVERRRDQRRQLEVKRALVAVGNSILTGCWHLLSDPAARFTDLGPDSIVAHRPRG